MRRVLVADNDRQLPGELEAALRAAPGEWDVVWAMSTREALQQLSKTAFDVVLASLSGPGIDGVALLDEVAVRQSAAVRFLLGHPAEARALLRGGAAAHQYLLKPLQADDLFGRLARTLRLGDLLSDTALQALVSRFRSLPSPPAVYLAVVAELRKEDASPRKVGELVARDAGIAAKILQLVNSPLLGLRMRVADPVQAVQFLGIDTVRALVLSSHVFEQIDVKTAARFQLTRAWRHAVAAGGCARTVAEAEGAAPEEASEAFTAALLHDVGKLLLVRALPNDYADVLDQAAADTVPAWVAERDLLGTTHAEIGAYLLSLWGLPHAVVEAVAWHHRPAESLATAFGALGAVHVGNVIAHRVHPGDTAGVPSDLDAGYLERLQVSGRLPAWSAGCAAR